VNIAKTYIAAFPKSWRFELLRNVTLIFSWSFHSPWIEGNKEINATRAKLEKNIMIQVLIYEITWELVYKTIGFHSYTKCTTRWNGRITAVNLLSSSGHGDIMLNGSCTTSEVKSIIGHSSIDAVPKGNVQKSTSWNYGMQLRLLLSIRVNKL